MYDKNNVWVDTVPKDVIDYGDQENLVLKLELKSIQDEYNELKLSSYKD